MRELLRCHEREIFDWVILQLRTQSRPLPPITSPSPHALYHFVPGTQPAPADRSLTRLVELESQLAELRATNQQDHLLLQPRTLGMWYPTQTPIIDQGGSTSGIVDSVKTLFPRLERPTLVQIF